VTLFCGTNTSGGSMAAAAIPSELSRWSSEIFYEILFFPCFIVEKNCSQVCALPESSDVE